MVTHPLPPSGLPAGLQSWWILPLILALLLPRVAAEPSFTAELVPDSVAAGGTATLKLIFTDLGDVARPTLPALTNATVEYAGTGRQFSVVNLSHSSSIIHQFAIQPQNEGVVYIPALSVEVGGQTYTSQPLTLRVGQAMDLSSIGFLRLVAPRSEFYVGETFPLEIRFYYRRVPDRQVPPTLALDGFIKGRQAVDNLPPETITNLVYSVVRWSIALTAVKAGDLTVGPAEFQTIYTFQDPNRRRSRGLQSLFEPLFGGVEQRQLTFASEPLTLRVLNPPAAGQPPTFAGAVGRFSLDVTASPTNVAVGDPVTVRVNISGQGNFDGLRLPDLPEGVAFQLYPGTNSFTEGDPLGLSGSKTFEAVVVPERAGVQTLKWPWLTFWDPGTKAYVTDQPRPLSFNVRPGATAQAAPVGTVPGPPEPREPTPGHATASDLALLQNLGPLVALSPSPVTTPWFWGVLGLPLAVYAALVLGPILRKRHAKDPTQIAREQAHQAVAEHLAALSRQAERGQASEFFTSLNEAVQQQLALTVGGIPGCFTEEVVDTHLIPHGLPPDDAQRLRNLFARLTEARFSPTASGGELTALRQEAEHLLAVLRSLGEGK